MKRVEFELLLRYKFPYTGDDITAFQWNDNNIESARVSWRKNSIEVLKMFQLISVKRIGRQTKSIKRYIRLLKLRLIRKCHILKM